MPASLLTQLRQAPFWPALEDIADTLVYESTLLGDMPTLAEHLPSITVPTLVISSRASRVEIGYPVAPNEGNVSCRASGTMLPCFFRTPGSGRRKARSHSVSES